MRKKSIEIKQEWMKPETITFKIPTNILDKLGIQRMNTTQDSNSFSRSPTTTKS
jgi:hypothetical protein